MRRGSDHYFVTLQAVVDGASVGIGLFLALDADRAAGRIEMPFVDQISKGPKYHALMPLGVSISQGA
ncbi:hypothetical protein AB3X91_39835 [Paraburkholderia sp. BR14263]|uniref:hypothetical protein n=1 Tax=unclassified Paraburkholderia TaxID=2615204 RepID=UPI0034CF697F